MTQSIDELIEIIGKRCKDKNYSLVTAESCTGGGLAYFITKNPKSSSILERGYVTYSLAAKESNLNVSAYALQAYGPVSQEVAKQMAEGALKNSTAQISIAITGVEEDGEKKGLVWIACSGNNKQTIAKEFEITGSREIFINKSVNEALIILLKFIS
ncbi:MAG TPA: CinA family protein [Gammaproteobacteria bacterium]|nr:CinA family protein [Gammaproteobacteria bacterium]